MNTHTPRGNRIHRNSDQPHVYKKVSTFSYFPTFRILPTAPEMSNENSLNKLIAKRSSIKSQLSLFQRFLDTSNETNTLNKLS